MAELKAQQAATGPAANVDYRRFLPVLVYCVGLFALYHDTLWSMIQIWESSKTYKHGYIIAPISLWLIWDRRAQLRRIPVQPALSVTGLVLLVGPVWLLANLVDVNVIRQASFVALLIVGIWALLGHSLARAIAFPLGFLFFAVPAGDALVPIMLEITATSTVWLVKMTGIPVYREGLYFMLPSGSWSVVYACSGVRYLIAAVTLGVVYAYLTYRSLKRRLLFCLVSLIVPVLANSARAYIIVMLGHLSGMKLAVGVDHLLYGWVFFGIVMFLLFWLGTFWREDLDEELQDPAPQKQPVTGGSGWLVLLAALFVAAVWPALSAAMQNRAGPAITAQLQAPPAAAGWQQGDDPGWNWRPERNSPDREVVAFYASGADRVALFVGQHLKQEQGRELISGLNLFIDEDEVWRLLDRGASTVDLGGRTVRVDRVHLAASDQQLLLWSWYRIGERYTAHRYVAELFELLEEVTFSDRGSAHIVIATATSDNGAGEDILRQFVAAHLDGVEHMLAQGLESR